MGTLIDFHAGLPHYARHLAPIWEALPEDRRGRFTSQRVGQPWGPQVRRPQLGDLVVVASYQDLLWAAREGRRFIHVEHGAGQTYGGEPGFQHPSYAGGSDPVFDLVDLFLTPGEHGARRWREARPRARAEAIGCPKLDALRSGPSPDPKVVAWTWHWDCTMIPETRSAFHHYRARLGEVIDSLRWLGCEVIGHAHPKGANMIRPEWERLGVEFVPTEAEVFARAGTLIADNTSMLYEFAALGRGTVVLNAPWYRRDIHHGLRFWDHPPGPMVDEPLRIPEMIASVVGLDHGLAIRNDAAAAAYAHTTGAAARAAQLLLEIS